jgi:hypothetical protein
MSFVKRRIDVTITLGSGSFDGTDTNTITLTGLRVIANLAGAGGKYFGMLQCQIYGVTQKLMNQLTLVGSIGTVNVNNVITVLAGDEGKTLTKIFEGNIFLAYGNYDAMPEVCLCISALPSAVNLVQPAAGLSYPGPVAAAQVMSDLAMAMGLTLSNHNVNAQLPASYFFGSHIDQLRQCADAANINLTIENGILSIWPSDGVRAQEIIPLISTRTGMVGRPTFSQQGITVTSEFLPTCAIGTLVHIESDITPANGTFYVTGIIHQLSSEMPDGPWFTQVAANPVPVQP